MSTGSSATEAVALCRRLQAELFGAARLDVADDLLTADFVDHEVPSGTPRGPEAARQTVRWLHAAFSGIRYEVDDAFAAADRVVMRCRILGQHTGPFLGVAPTGRSFVEKQIHIFRVEGGRVAEHWACRDDLALLRQLGASISLSSP